MSATCGHVLDDGRECRRRVRVEGDRCHLHPWARIRPGTVVDGDVSVVVFGWDLVSVDAEGVRVWLPERAALRLARDLYESHTIDDVKTFRSLSDQVEAFRSYSDQARTDAVETDEVEPWESN